MIPTLHLISLILILVCVINTFLQRIGVMIKNKNIRMVCNLLLYTISGYIWSYTQFNGHLNSLFWLIIVCFTFGTLIGVLLLAITWVDNSIDVNTSDDYEIKYTPETLIGMKGVVDSYYSEGKYLGRLNDANNTTIVVKILGDVPYGFTFVITDINGSDINAKLSD